MVLEVVRRLPVGAPDRFGVHTKVSVAADAQAQPTEVGVPSTALDTGSTEPVAVLTCAVRRVEREVARRELAVGQAAGRAGQVLAERQALVIGLIQSFNEGLTWMTPGGDWTRSIVFGILIAVLVFRPQGILGEQTPEGA